MGERVASRRCGTCRKVFSKPSYLSWSSWEKTKYCSRHCSGVAHRKSRETRRCEQCNTLFTRQLCDSSKAFARRRFCSHACSFAFQKIDRLSVPKHAAKGCERCGNAIVRGERSARQWRNMRYCSVSCSSFARWAKDAKTFPDSCEICGENRVVVRAHIIAACDGGSRDRWNTVVLCPTHHDCMDRGRLTRAELNPIRAHIEAAVETAKLFDLDITTLGRQSRHVLAAVS